MAGRHVLVLAVVVAVTGAGARAATVPATGHDSIEGNTRGNKNASAASQDDGMEGLEWGAREYGKRGVKLLHVFKEGDVHTIQEFEVMTQLTLDSDKEYKSGNNSDVVATDTQKNIIYILAKRHGVKSPEEFALLLSDFFLKTYQQVISAFVSVKEFHWQRQVEDGEPHNHAFIHRPEAEHTAKVFRRRGEAPRVWSGLTGLQLLKTSQSSFTGFHQDAFTVLKEAGDRILSSVLSVSWRYDDPSDINFEKTWLSVVKIAKDTFSGPPKTGVHSSSLQATAYGILKGVIRKIPQVAKAEVEMLNNHYFGIDLSKFPGVGDKENDQVFLPVHGPIGVISASMLRKEVDQA